MLGSLYLETGETAGARTLYENALEEGSHPAAAYNGLALCDILEDFQEDMVARAILMAGKAARYGDNFAEFDSDTKLFFD